MVWKIINTISMWFGSRITLKWRSISLWVLVLISGFFHVSEARLGMEPFSPGVNTRSLVQQHAGSKFPTYWLPNVINERLPHIVEKNPSWHRKIEVDDRKEGSIIFNSIRGVIENNATIVKLEVQGEGDFVVTNITLTYNGGEEEMQLSTGWTGELQVFNFTTDIFESENIQLSLTGRNGDMDSPVTARGSAAFEFKDPDVKMAFVGSDTKTSIRIAGEVPDSGVSGSVKCSPPANVTACYDLEKEESYCKIVTTTEGSNVTVCDSSRYIDPLNELPGKIDLEWMTMTMPMDRMDMEMPMLMVMATFSQMPAKIEVLVYADDDPSKLYSPEDYSCEIEDEATTTTAATTTAATTTPDVTTETLHSTVYSFDEKDDMGMAMVMCNQMLPENIPGNQEGVQVLVVALDEYGTVIQSGVQHSIVHEDFTAIIVGSCLAAVVGMACIVALIGCYVEKKKKKKLQV